MALVFLPKGKQAERVGLLRPALRETDDKSLKGGKAVEFIIFTNNPAVNKKYGDKYCVFYQDCTYMQIFEKVRDKIHQGHKLLTHPLSGSVKPNETPYKSVMLTAARGALDKDSVVIIEDCIMAARKFSPRKIVFTEKLHNDFQLVDLTLIESGIQSATTV